MAADVFGLLKLEHRVFMAAERQHSFGLTGV